MVAHRRRKPRQMTFRGLERRLQREERREVQRNLGQWVYEGNSYEATLSSSAKNILLFSFSAAGTSSRVDKDEIYLPEGAYGLSLKKFADGSNDPVVIGGAVAVLNMKDGQSASDFLGDNQGVPSGYKQGNQNARFAAYYPFVLSSRNGGDGAMLTVPLHLAFGPKRRKVLKPNENLRMYALFDSDISTINVFLVGYQIRYRLIRHEQALSS